MEECPSFIHRALMGIPERNSCLCCILRSCLAAFFRRCIGSTLGPPRLKLVVAILCLFCLACCAVCDSGVPSSLPVFAERGRLYVQILHKFEQPCHTEDLATSVVSTSETSRQIYAPRISRICFTSMAKSRLLTWKIEEVLRLPSSNSTILGKLSPIVASPPKQAPAGSQRPPSRFSWRFKVMSSKTKRSGKRLFGSQTCRPDASLNRSSRLSYCVRIFLRRCSCSWWHIPYTCCGLWC